MAKTMDVFVSLLPILLLAVFAAMVGHINLWRIDKFLKEARDRRPPKAG
jgi:hypothetical protein